MKWTQYNKVAIFCVTTVVSVGALFSFYSSSEASIDKNMKWEDYNGDRRTLDGVTFENVISDGKGGYERAAVTHQKTTFHDTQFDQLYFVGEDVLKYKDLYRGKAHAAFWEDDRIAVTATFNPKFPYRNTEQFVELSVQTKKTDKVKTFQAKVDGFKQNSHNQREMLTYVNDKLYFIIRNSMWGNETNDHIYVYEVNVNKGTLTKVNDIHITGAESYISDTNIIGEKLYVSAKEKGQFVIKELNLRTNKMRSEVVEGNQEEGVLVGDDETVCIISYETGDVTFIDAKTLKTKDIKGDAKFFRQYEEKGEMFSVEKALVKNGNLHVTYKNYANEANYETTYIVAYDMKTGASLYEGMLPTMKNRGVGLSYTMK